MILYNSLALIVLGGFANYINTFEFVVGENEKNVLDNLKRIYLRYLNLNVQTIRLKRLWFKNL